MQESVGIKSLNLASHLQQYGVKYQETQNWNFDYTYNHMIVNQNNLIQYLARNGMVLQGNIQADESFTVLSPQWETITFHKTTPKLKKDLSTNINPNNQTQEDGTSTQTGDEGDMNEDEGSTQTDDEGDMNENKDEGEKGQGEEESSRTGDKLEQNIQKDITQTQEDLSDAIQKWQNEKFITIMKKIRSRRNELGRKTILQTLKTTTSSYKTEIKQWIKMLLDNIWSKPQTALQWLKMLTSNGLKLWIVLFNLLPISPVPWSGTVLLLWLLLNEFKTKWPLYDAIMELHDAVMDDPPSQPNIAQQPSVLSEVYLTYSSMKINKTTVPDEQKRIFEKIPWYEDIKLWSHILDLHRWETSDASEIKSWFKALQEKLLQAKNNWEKLPSHILWLSNLSFVLGKYWFSIFDSLPVEVYTQVWQYKRLFGEIDPKNPLTPVELKQKERIWQNNDGKHPIKVAIIDTESFLKLNFNGQNKNIQSAFTKQKIDDSKEINQSNINQKDISDFQNESEFYRVIVGDDAFNDIVESGVARVLEPKDKIKSTEFIISLDRRGTTAFPSFAKGRAAMEYAKNNENNYIVVTQDPSLQPSKIWRHGKWSTMFPTDENWNHMKELHGDKVKVYKHIGNGKYELVYEYWKKINNKNPEVVKSSQNIGNSHIEWINSLTTHYPDLLKNIVNPETLSQIIQTETNAWNLVLNPDGTIKEVFVAVNGEKKPSQLFEKMKTDWFSEQQALKTWLQVRTPEFKNRFGDWQSADKSQVSKVVDENGEPLVVYHRTHEKFNEFSLSWKEYNKHMNTSTKDGYYFIHDWNKYEYYWPRKMACFLKANNIWRLDQNTAWTTSYWSRTIRLNDGTEVPYGWTLASLDKKIVHDEWWYDWVYGVERYNKVKEENFVRDQDWYNTIITGYDIYGSPIRGVKTNLYDADAIVVFDPKNIKSAIDNDWSFSPETAKFNDYFWKESRFWFDSKQARDHSVYMDKVAAWFKKWPSNLAEWLDDVRDKIQKLYTDKTGKTLELTDAQIQTIIATHLKSGELGKLTQAELRAKVAELATAIPDATARRFLLEAGFCGMEETSKANFKNEQELFNKMTAEQILPIYWKHSVNNYIR